MNSVREQVGRELLPAFKVAFFRPGILEAKTGDAAAAKQDLYDLLSMSATFSDIESLISRRQAGFDPGGLR